MVVNPNPQVGDVYTYYEYGHKRPSLKVTVIKRADKILDHCGRSSSRSRVCRGCDGYQYVTIITFCNSKVFNYKPFDIQTFCIQGNRFFESDKTRRRRGKRTVPKK